MRNSVYVDIDGTICTTEGTDYANAQPIPERIDKINAMHDAGDEIVYWTARGTKTGINWYWTTIHQLVEWGCRFSDLKFGKPAFDLYICDKVKNVKDL